MATLDKVVGEKRVLPPCMNSAWGKDTEELPPLKKSREEGGDVSKYSQIASCLYSCYRWKQVRGHPT